MNENQQTEFKELWKDEFLKHICAFANTLGGRLYIGIKFNGTIVGVKDSKKLMEDIPNKIIQMLGITVNIDSKIIEGKEIIEIHVLPVSVPISYHSRYYIRSGSTVQELHGQKLREFILKKDNITWDEIIIPTAQIGDLDINLIRRFVSKAVNANRLSVEALNEDITLSLKKLDLIKENGELTRAAILLFSNNPHKYIRTATVKIGRFGLNDADLISHDIIEGNLIDMPDKILDILRIKYLHSPISYEGIERKERLEYPEKALREAILNAIVHRDYGEQTDITIRVYNNKLVIWNSGLLISPLTVDMLKKEHPSKRRNALIANIFFRIGYIEAWGRGIILMTSVTKEAGLPELLIEEYAGGVQITFLKDAAEKVGEKVGEKDLSENQKTILKEIKKNSRITISKLSSLVGIAEKNIEKNLKILKKAGIIERIGPAKGGYWEIIN